MKKDCAIIPKVFNKKGIKVDSRLFKDLLSFNSNNRQKAYNQYLIIQSEDFINNYLPKLEVDENGEPTIHSLLEKTNLDKYINQEQILEVLNRKIGFYKREADRPAYYLDNKENYDKLIKKVIEFNTTSDFKNEYIARIIRIPDNESHRLFLGVRVYPKTKLYSIEADKMEYNYSLNEKLKNILASKGISIGSLTTLEERLGVSGVAEFDIAKVSAEGLIELIRLANGERGEKALPEEFAHCIFEMLDNNLSDRFMNLLYKDNLVLDILGNDYNEYYSLYNGDQVRLAKEAAGKLLAKHLLNEETIPNKPYKNLLERIISYIKNILKKLDIITIKEAMVDADKQFGDLAKGILNGTLDNSINIKNISSSDRLFKITKDRVERDKKLLNNIIKNELKRYKVYEGRSGKETFDAKQKAFIDGLTQSLEENQEIEGIYSFVNTALDELKKVNKRLLEINSSPVSSNEKARVLRDVRNYIFSYKHMASEIREAVIDEERYEDNRYNEGIKETLNSLSNLLDDLYIRYTNESMPIFIDFIKPFLGNTIVVPFGKYKGKKIRVEELVKIADRDISFFDRWLDSMADSSDYMIKILDQAIKDSKDNARLKTIDIMKELQSAHMKLEKSGIKDTDWMFEVDSNGNKTGNYISEINHSLYKENMRNMFNSLNEKYGRNPVGKDAISYNSERSKWFRENTEVVNGIRQPKMSLYKNTLFSELSKAQKEYYNTIINIKEKLDSHLPEGATTLLNTVKIRKDLLERVKASKDVKSGLKQVWESIKDEFMKRSDDIDFKTKSTIKDFENHEVQTLPIYYTRIKDDESMNDISTDVTSTMIAYSSMVNDYIEMNKIVDVLELGRDLLREREVQETKSGKPLVEKFKSLGSKVESKVIKTREKSYFMDRLNDFFEMQVYGKYMADEGTFGESNIDKGKVANFINKVTSMNTLALNLLAGISNVLTGTVMMRIESFSGEFFSEKDTLNADRNYSKELPKFLSEIGNRVKTSKLALWGELFNVMQDYETNVRETNFDRKTWFSRMFGTSALFMISNAGEHWMQYRTSLALANNYKMRDPNGNLVSLWDAMEVVYIDQNNKSLGAKLEIKEGYTKEDGTQFTNEDIKKFSRKASAINQRMHGIYNKLDRSSIQRLAIGRLGMLYRKWIRPSFNRRFGSASYNFDLQAWTEGYYNTTGKFLTRLGKELIRGQLTLASNWNNLTGTEKSNIKRAITEVSHLLATMAVISIIENSDEDDDNIWLTKMIEYQSRRLFTELGAMVPGPQILEEGLRILKSPAAGINTIESALDLVDLLNPNSWEVFGGEDAIIQTGKYKGKSKGMRIILNSPLIPMNKTIYKGLHPEESIPFFKQ